MKKISCLTQSYSAGQTNETFDGTMLHQMLHPFATHVAWQHFAFSNTKSNAKLLVSLFEQNIFGSHNAMLFIMLHESFKTHVKRVQCCIKCCARLTSALKAGLHFQSFCSRANFFSVNELGPILAVAGPTKKN